MEHRYKRIVACISTQANRQLSHGKTTFSVHLKRMFGTGREADIAGIEKFAARIGEIIFFIDEVTGDRAGRQTAQEMIEFGKEIKKRFDEIGKPCPLKFRTLIADASLINASSVETYLNRTRSHPDQILFSGNADRKGLSLESARISERSAKIINANVYPASKLTLKWRPVIDFCAEISAKRGDDPVRKAYRELENRILENLAGELIQGWRKKPEEQIIVIIQNKEFIDLLKNYIGNLVETHGRASLRHDKLKGIAYRPPKSVSSFVAGFKSSATKRTNEYQNTAKSSLWQSRFHDHIIRNDDEYAHIKQYIETNIMNWADDTLYTG
jgi:hypothetical protein